MVVSAVNDGVVNILFATNAMALGISLSAVASFRLGPARELNSVVQGMNRVDRGVGGTGCGYMGYVASDQDRDGLWPPTPAHPCSCRSVNIISW